MNHLASIDLASLVTVTGGTTQSTGDSAITQQLQTVTSALDDLKKSRSSQSGISQYLPIMMMAKMMRG